MKSDEPYALVGSASKSGVDLKFVLIAVACLAIGAVAGIRWKERSAPESIAAPQMGTKVAPPTVPSVSIAEIELTKKNAELIATNERLAAQLKAQAGESEHTAKKAKEAEEQRAQVKSQRLLGQIVLKLERVKDEAIHFTSYSSAGDLGREESRLKTLAREQESQARSIVADMKEAGFADTDKLERLIADFTRNYGFYVAAQNTSWKVALMSGHLSDETLARATEYQKKYYTLLSRIKMFPREMPDIP